MNKKWGSWSVAASYGVSFKVFNISVKLFVFTREQPIMLELACCQGDDNNGHPCRKKMRPHRGCREGTTWQGRTGGSTQQRLIKVPESDPNSIEKTSILTLVCLSSCKKTWQSIQTCIMMLLFLHYFVLSYIYYSIKATSILEADRGAAITNLTSRCH